MGVLAWINRQKSSADELNAYLNKEFARRMSERSPFELQWQLNISFINNMQYLQINPFGNELIEIPQLYWYEERKVYNHIAPIVDTRISLLQRIKPKFSCRPGPDGSDSDRGATRVSSAILQTLTYDLNLSSIIGELVAWLEFCGTVVLKNIWDQNIGPSYPVIYPDGKMELVREGSVNCVVCPPQEILPDSSWHYDVKACRSIMHAKVYHVDDARDIFNTREIEPEENTAVKLTRSMTTAGAGGFATLQSGYRAATVKMKDHVVIRELWELPSKEYPKGRLLIGSGKKFVYAGNLPYPVGEDGEPALPFERIQSLKNPGCFWGRSVVERLIPLQQQYNALRNRKTEYLNRCSIGQIAYEEDTIDPDLLEKEIGAPGGMIPYSRGARPPQYMDNPQLPAAFETEQTAILNEMTIISGVSEISRLSQAPPGVKSGVALNIAVDQDQSRLSQTAGAITDGLTECGKQWLRMSKAFVRGPRLIRQIGKQNILALQYWTGSDIKSEDVIVDMGSLITESPESRRQMVFDLIKSELFNDPQTGKLTNEGRAKIFEMLEFGDWENFEDVDQRHIDKADRENLKMLQGNYVAPANFDAHDLHISRLNRCRVSVEYEDAVAENPDIAAIFEQHVQEHLALMQAMQAPAAPPDLVSAGLSLGAPQPVAVGQSPLMP